LGVLSIDKAKPAFNDAGFSEMDPDCRCRCFIVSDSVRILPAALIGGDTFVTISAEVIRMSRL